MRNLPTHKAKIVHTIIIFTCILFYIEITAQQSNDLTSHLKQCWELTTDKMTLLGLASDNESKFTFYLPLLNGEIESINSTTGKKNWGSEFGGEIILPPFSDNKSVYILSKINTKTLLYSLSKELGITNWQTEFDFNDEFFLAEANNKLILLSRHGTLSVLNKDNGTLIWSRKLEQELSSTPILF